MTRMGANLKTILMMMALKAAGDCEKADRLKDCNFSRPFARFAGHSYFAR
jgi:hypothetical protein